MRGDRKRDLNAASGRQPQGITQAVAGHEVGRDREDAVLGAKAGVEQQRLRRVFGLVRAAGEKLGQRATVGQRGIRTDGAGLAAAH